jgi:hypothetical protein
MQNGSGVFLLSATAAGGLFWPGKNCSTPSLYLRPSIPTRGGKDGMGGMALSLVEDTMVRGYLECVLKVIYHTTYVGIVFRSLVFETSKFHPSTSKSRVITTDLRDFDR